ncbi:MAG: CDP-alcohol phosphatidyltransferase family protein [Muribaculaceae bacterium]|nr:CDP-alcohol phosphatidyltransferase family protein [Muribaculaceae bacterium]MDE7081751.1 CDP-alcohol phosphatidyltransferase family protein [Muribaculaceae bacterium]
MSSRLTDLKREYKASLKSSDTEETFDLIFYRPIGFFWAKLAARLGVTPNAITIASIIIGIGAGVAFYFNDFWINVAGALLLMWADSFDSADGQLARMTKQYSRIGRILDGLSGDIWFVCIYAAICLRENVTSHFFMEHTWVIWVLAAVTGAFHAIQAAMADYYRQFHLYFVKGEEGSELETASRLWDKFHSLSWRRDFWQKLVLMFYTNYTVGQEKRTPSMQRLRRSLAAVYGGKIPLAFREKFRAASKPLMKYTNILSFNTRCFALFAAILIFRMPWLYFAFELVVLNIILVYMMVRHERICRKAMGWIVADRVSESA